MIFSPLLSSSLPRGFYVVVVNRLERRFKRTCDRLIDRPTTHRWIQSVEVLARHDVVNLLEQSEDGFTIVNVVQLIMISTSSIASLAQGVCLTDDFLHV